jgi:hypothetical protein
MTKTFQLYCPSNKRTVDGFVVTPHQTNDRILQAVRLALGINYAAIYTTEGKHITDLRNSQDGSRIFIAATSEEEMLPDAPVGFILYNGEEGTDADPDTEGYGQDWVDATEEEKCVHITSLNEVKPTTRNTMRITRPWEDVQTDLKMLEKVTWEQLATAFDPADCKLHIEQRWRMTYEHFLPENMKPAKLKIGGKICDEKALAALDMLSSFTHGQVRLVQEFLEECVKMRAEEGEDKSAMVQYQDIINAATMIYERAGIIPAKVRICKRDVERWRLTNGS